MTDEQIVDELRRRDRQMRRDMRAAVIRAYRYMTRTPLEQQRADSAAANRAVVERGWITK